MKINDYQQEQLDALKMVRHGLFRLGDAGRRELVQTIVPYLQET